MLQSLALGHALCLLLASPAPTATTIVGHPWASTIRHWVVAAPPPTSFRQVRYRELTI